MQLEVINTKGEMMESLGIIEAVLCPVGTPPCPLPPSHPCISADFNQLNQPIHLYISLRASLLRVLSELSIKKKLKKEKLQM